MNRMRLESRGRLRIFLYFRNHPAEAELYGYHSATPGNAEAIANHAYAGKNGKSANVASGDGWNIAAEFYRPCFLPRARLVSEYKRIRINVFAAPDWIEVKRIEKEPEEVDVRLVRADQSETAISTSLKMGSHFQSWLVFFKIGLREGGCYLLL